MCASPASIAPFCPYPATSRGNLYMSACLALHAAWEHPQHVMYAMHAPSVESKLHSQTSQ